MNAIDDATWLCDFAEWSYCQLSTTDDNVEYVAIKELRLIWMCSKTNWMFFFSMCKYPAYLIFPGKKYILIEESNKLVYKPLFYDSFI